jgi:hypothetical protein
LVQSDIDPGEIVVLSGFISQSGGYSVSPEGGVIVPDSGDYQIFFGVLPDNAPSSIRLEINGFYMFPSAFSTRGGNDFVTGHVIVTLAKGDIVTIVSNSVTDPFGTALGDNETRPSTPTSMTILQLTSTSETAAQECCNLLFGTDTP